MKFKLLSHNMEYARFARTKVPFNGLQNITWNLIAFSSVKLYIGIVLDLTKPDLRENVMQISDAISKYQVIRRIDYCQILILLTIFVFQLHSAAECMSSKRIGLTDSLN